MGHVTPDHYCYCFLSFKKSFYYLLSTIGVETGVEIGEVF